MAAGDEVSKCPVTGVWPVVAARWRSAPDFRVLPSRKEDVDRDDDDDGDDDDDSCAAIGDHDDHDAELEGDDMR